MFAWKEETAFCRMFDGAAADRRQRQFFENCLGRPAVTAPYVGARRRIPGSTARASDRGCSIGFPVVIGAGSHPFPFRTRKLSLLPPMVLRGQLRGRVGHCRDYFRLSLVLERASGFFCFR